MFAQCSFGIVANNVKYGKLQKCILNNGKITESQLFYMLNRIIPQLSVKQLQLVFPVNPVLRIRSSLAYVSQLHNCISNRASHAHFIRHKIAKVLKIKLSIVFIRIKVRLNYIYLKCKKVSNTSFYNHFRMKSKCNDSANIETNQLSISRLFIKIRSYKTLSWNKS